MMKQYTTLKEMIEAKAEQTHEANLDYGGVFDENGNRVSNLDFEIKYAAKKVLVVKGGYAGMTIGVELPENCRGVSYIKNFGYVKLN